MISKSSDSLSALLSYRNLTPEAKRKLFFWAAIGAVLLRACMFAIHPRLSTDGPWYMSPVFSYMNGKGDYSLFGNEFMGPMYSVNLTDFLFSAWFRMTGVHNWSFIVLGMSAIIATIAIWHSLLRARDNDDAWPSLLLLSYALSPYSYMFRPECFSILVASVMVLCLKRVQNENLRWPLSGALAVLAGLIHPLGGMFSVIVVGYYLMQHGTSLLGYIKMAGWSLMLAMIMSGGHLLQYLQMFLNLPGDSQSHFAGLDAMLLLKFFYQGAPFTILILPFAWMHAGLFGRLTLSAAILLLLLMGRSYYYPYLHLVLLATWVFEKRKGMSIPRMYGNLLWASFAYAWTAFLLLPFGLILFSRDANAQWKDVLTAIDKEEKTWLKDGKTKYYLPAELSMEVYDNVQARLLYSWMRIDCGVQDARSKVFYVYQPHQLNWVKKCFYTEGTTWKVEVVEPARSGIVRMASIYRFKALKEDSLGLWKLTAVPATTQIPAPVLVNGK